jgi:hypothetical protein
MRILLALEPARFAAAAAAAAVALTVTGCQSTRSTPAARAPSVQPDELAAHDGEVCPQRLPIGEDPGGHGFGVEGEAGERPSLLTPEEAWACRYDPVDAGRSPGGGTVFEWVRRGEVRALHESVIPGLEAALDGLGLFGGERACTDDLGSRWMIVYTHGGDLTGAVIDDYGCREVRLTDEPFTTPPGASHRQGTVRGTLDGGGDLLAQLDLGRQG